VTRSPRQSYRSVAVQKTTTDTPGLDVSSVVISRNLSVSYNRREFLATAQCVVTRLAEQTLRRQRHPPGMQFLVSNSAGVRDLQRAPRRGLATADWSATITLEQPTSPLPLTPPVAGGASPLRDVLLRAANTLLYHGNQLTNRVGHPAVG
jgi:hypothetical protein